ncbi:hypothetical protein BY458DRAFT_432906 [Sporodiniella umbellata]|nr:hypothetical protein BY458DRAFT_432906 [Sporodiniella umbellata]
MAEREFQNMFTFCPGFEAASLKWHCKDQEDEVMPSNSNQGKKQMIGFARFRTRLEALESIEVLSGKKVDQDKGTVLKAEMAKKNLHIKRTLGTAGSVSTSTSSTLNSNMVSSSIHPTASESKELSRGIYDDFSPLPSDLFGDLKSDLYPEPLLPSHHFSDSLFAIRSHSFDQDLGFISRLGLAPSHFSTQPNSSPMRANFMNDTEADTLPYLPSDMHRLGSLSVQRTADQNPPCNTLYVGNLSAHTSEEELRTLFTAHKGYRRMCFRTKSQGPMCFVEFEDVVCASQALNALQGHALSNSVKGGIRLSFSKNPLFIKPATKENGAIHFKHLGHPIHHDHNRRDFAFDPQL